MSHSHLPQSPSSGGPERTSPAAFLGDGLLLLLLLVSVTAFCVQTYGLDAEPSVLWILCPACGICSLVLWSFLRGPKAITLLLGTLALLLAAALYQGWELFSFGALLQYQTAAEQLTEAVGFPGFFQLPVSLPPAEPQLAFRWFWGISLPLYALILGWAVVRLRSCWLSLALTLMWFLPAFLAELPFSWLWVAAAAGCWMALFLSSLMGRSSSTGGGKLRLASLPAGLLAAALLVSLFPAGSYQQPAWTGDARIELTDLGTRIGIYLMSGMESGTTAASPTEDAAEDVDLAAAGPQQFTGGTVLRLEGGMPGVQYLRGEAYASYTGQSWERLDAAALEELAGELGEWSLNTPLFFPAAATAEQPSHSLTITHIDRPSAMIYTPYQPAALTGSIQDAQLTGDSALRLTDARWSYTVPFLPAEPAPLSQDSPLTQVEQAYRQFVYQHYLDVPASTAAALSRWRSQAEAQAGVSQAADSSGPYGDVLTQAARVAELLAATTEYDLDTPRMEAGSDFAVYFLEEAHRGYCMHYASAAALLLRLEGIPTRYVSGYLADIPASGRASVPDSAAHAWVEVYLDGYGWYPVEVTPSSGIGVLPSPQETPAEEAPPEETAPEETVPPTSETEEPQLPAEEEPAEIQGAGVAAPWLAAAAAAVILLAAVTAFALRRRHRWGAFFSGRNTNAAVIDAYGWFQQLGRWGGHMDREVEAAAEKARFSQHRLTAEERDAVLARLREEIIRCGRTQPTWKRPLYRLLFPVQD